MLREENGSLWLIDLRDGERHSPAGIDLTETWRSESPDGRMILFAFQKWASDDQMLMCYPKIALLDSETGEMRVLTRELSGHYEILEEFLDENTIVIRSRKDENGGYYLYVYEFT